jgi:hypothetical protein
MKTSELTGAALDWAVAKCEGATNLWHDTVATWWVAIDGEPRALSSGWSPRQSWHPSTDWSKGGPIIERELIALEFWHDEDMWGAVITSATSEGIVQFGSGGPTPLVAAMRCYVASKLGDNIDIPEELT